MGGGTLRTTRLTRWILTLAVTAACTGKKREDVDFASLPAGGYVFATDGVIGTNALPGFVGAYFIDSATGVPDDFLPPYSSFPREECAPVVYSTNATVTQADVASSLTFTSGATTVEALRDSTNFYSEATPSADIAGTTWDVTTVGGSFVEPQTWEGLITVPGAVQILTPGATVTAGDLEVTWTPMGAELVIVNVRTFDRLDAHECYANDDGAFTIPASVMASLATNFSLVVVGLNVEYRDVGGRRVGFEGSQIAQKNVLKQ